MKSKKFLVVICAILFFAALPPGGYSVINGIKAFEKKSEIEYEQEGSPFHQKDKRLKHYEDDLKLDTYLLIIAGILITPAIILQIYFPPKE